MKQCSRGVPDLPKTSQNGSMVRDSATLDGGPISVGELQERILNKAVARDARCAVLESTHVQITIHACSQGLPPDPVHTQSAQIIRWETLDGVDLSEVFQRRFRVMQGGPHHLRGRFRQAVRSVLEVRHEAVRSQDIVTETRAWKIFCLFFSVLVAQTSIGWPREPRRPLRSVRQVHTGRVAGPVQRRHLVRSEGSFKGKRANLGGKRKGSMPEGAVGRGPVRASA